MVCGACMWYCVVGCCITSFLAVLTVATKADIKTVCPSSSESCGFIICTPQIPFWFPSIFDKALLPNSVIRRPGLVPQFLQQVNHNDYNRLQKSIVPRLSLLDENCH